jgi:hypothetical protein
MDKLWMLALISLTGGISLRCFHEISSFADGAPNRYDRPMMLNRHPWIATAGGVMILPVAILLGVAGYKLAGWVAAVLTPVLTIALVVPIAYQVFRARDSFFSILTGSPFFLLLPMFPAFIVLLALAF